METKANAAEISHQSDGECCSTSAAGGAICVVPSARQTRINVSLESIGLRNQPAVKVRLSSAECWQTTRSGILFGVACLASPCCAPLIVPLILSVLAGTPLALWMSHNLGWVYGGLTLLSVVSFVLALRHINKRASQ